jgi:excisionase family DNA binding protein
MTEELSDLPNKKLLRITEAAEYFGVEERTIRLWIAHGKLKSEKPNNGAVFITRESIKTFRLLNKDRLR